MKKFIADLLRKVADKLDPAAGGQTEKPMDGPGPFRPK